MELVKFEFDLFLFRILGVHNLDLTNDHFCRTGDCDNSTIHISAEIAQTVISVSSKS